VHWDDVLITAFGRNIQNKWAPGLGLVTSFAIPLFSPTFFYLEPVSGLATGKPDTGCSSLRAVTFIYFTADQVAALRHPDNGLSNPDGSIFSRA